MTRLRFLLNSKGMDRFQPEARGTLSGVFNWVVRGKLEGAALEKKFARQRRALGDAQRLSERTEVKAIRDSYKAQRRDLSEQQKDDRQILKDKHDEEIRQFEIDRKKPSPDQVLFTRPAPKKEQDQQQTQAEIKEKPKKSAREIMEEKRQQTRGRRRKRR